MKRRIRLLNGAVGLKNTRYGRAVAQQLTVSRKPFR